VSTPREETRVLFRVFLAHHDANGAPVRPYALQAWRDQVLAAFPGGGGTVYDAVGRWAGEAEPTTVVECLVLAPYVQGTEDRLRHVLAGYAGATNQAATLYTKSPDVVCVWG